MLPRTFLASAIAEHTRRALAAVAESLDSGGAKVRFTAPGNLHVTLNFLGDVADDVLRRVCDAAVEAAAGIAPFEFSVCGLVPAPPRTHLRMIWANVQDPTGALGGLQEKLAASLETLGFPRENRPYRPHLTVARIKHIPDDRRIRAEIERLSEESFGAQQATEVTVFTSELTPSGPIYTPAGHAALAG